MVAGVPIFAVFYAGIRALVNRGLAKKNLPTDTAPYLTVGSIDASDTFTEYVPLAKKHKKNKEEQKSSAEEKE